VKRGGVAEQLNKKMELRPELLDIFFHALKTESGSVEAFMQKELGIGESESTILKKKYTI